MNNALLLEVKELSKEFPGTRALSRVSLEVRRGEVHGLCGENGAGKSTLMNIVGGVFPATRGSMKFDGNIFNPRKPKDSQDAGIGFVHQELCLCPHLSAAENIFIGRLPSIGGKIDFKKLYEDADAVLHTLDANFSSKTLVSNLTVSEQQLVEIAKSVSLNCKLLILDEPTSSLTDKETVKLFQVVKDLKKKGISTLFISHRMKEVFEICDRVTVLKDGSYVGCMNISEITHEDVIRAMVGRDLGELYPDKSSKIEEDNCIIKVENLSGDGFDNISFTLKKGEILGFAGLVGAGRSEVMRGLCAIDPIKHGEIFLNGEKQRFKRYRDAVGKGICYLTEDRKDSGLFLHMSIAKNITSANLEAVSKRGWIIKNREYTMSEKYVEALSIKIPGLLYPISNLSGGNQQKCLIGKWLSTDPKVIIMDEPTRGIDVGAKREIHNLLRSLSEQGVGVIIVSSELPEIIGVADRVAVMHEGKLAGFLQGEHVSEENIMKLASGASLPVAPGVSLS